MNMNIPRDPDTEKLGEALEAAGEASREVQELHDEINQALTSRTNR
jgi:hypothetical protein